MAMTVNDELTAGEVEILVDGLSDDVAFSWALIHLGIGTNLPAHDLPRVPTRSLRPSPVSSAWYLGPSRASYTRSVCQLVRGGLGYRCWYAPRNARTEAHLRQVSFTSPRVR